MALQIQSRQDAQNAVQHLREALRRRQGTSLAVFFSILLKI
jgi:hypothetical protein